MSEPTLEDFQNYMFDDDIDKNDPDLAFHLDKFMRTYGYYKQVVKIPEYKMNILNALQER